MSEQKSEMTGFQKFILSMGMAACKAALESYVMLSKQEKDALRKRTAKRMFDRAMQGKLNEPYDQCEIDFIKEALEIKEKTPYEEALDHVSK